MREVVKSLARDEDRRIRGISATIFAISLPHNLMSNSPTFLKQFKHIILTISNEVKNI